MVAVFGTMAADVLHVGLGIPYAVSTAFYSVVLAVIFVLWYRSEGSLSIHSQAGPSGEAGAVGEAGAAGPAERRAEARPI